MERFSYGMKFTVADDFDSTYERVVEALKENGFGVLTEIDVKATLKAKIDAEFRRYTILGACNPNLAFKGLSAEDDLGLLLPCNVVIYESEGGTTVSVTDPGIMSQMVDSSELAEVAAEAERLLKLAMEKVQSGG